MAGRKRGACREESGCREEILPEVAEGLTVWSEKDAPSALPTCVCLALPARLPMDNPPCCARRPSLPAVGVMFTNRTSGYPLQHSNLPCLLMFHPKE